MFYFNCSVLAWSPCFTSSPVRPSLSFFVQVLTLAPEGTAAFGLLSRFIDGAREAYRSSRRFWGTVLGVDKPPPPPPPPPAYMLNIRTGRLLRLHSYLGRLVAPAPVHVVEVPAVQSHHRQQHRPRYHHRQRYRPQGYREKGQGSHGQRRRYRGKGHDGGGEDHGKRRYHDRREPYYENERNQFEDDVHMLQAHPEDAHGDVHMMRHDEHGHECGKNDRGSDDHGHNANRGDDLDHQHGLSHGDNRHSFDDPGIDPRDDHH